MFSPATIATAAVLYTCQQAKIDYFYWLESIPSSTPPQNSSNDVYKCVETLRQMSAAVPTLPPLPPPPLSSSSISSCSPEISSSPRDITTFFASMDVNPRSVVTRNDSSRGFPPHSVNQKSLPAKSQINPPVLEGVAKGFRFQDYLPSILLPGYGASENSSSTTFAQEIHRGLSELWM